MFMEPPPKRTEEKRATQLLPSLDLPLESVDEDLEGCLWRVGFVLPSYFCVNVLPLIGHSFAGAHGIVKMAGREGW
jgi:hypothetical protein